MQKYLQTQAFQFSTQTNDGRINSSIDEDKVIQLLIEKFGDKIKKSKIFIFYISYKFLVLFFFLFLLY